MLSYRDNFSILLPAYTCSVPEAEGHCLSCCTGFIQEGRIGNAEPCEVCYRGLEVHQTLQSALRQFGLVGRVLSDPKGRKNHSKLHSKLGES